MIRVAAIAFAAFAAAVAASPAAAQSVVPESAAQLQLSFAPVVKATAPAVVNVYARKIVQARVRAPLFNDPFFRRFFGDRFPGGGPTRSRRENSLGSGVIVRPEGVIVTNNHVVAGAEEIRVVLTDRREFDADLLLADERTDLAVLKIREPGVFPSLSFGDSEALEVGDLVLAIGNPFGVGQTVTSGIVSALARTQVGSTDFGFFIQTDAAINPGNSGGALVDMAGRLVGVNTVIVTRSGGSNGVGFAIPSTMVNLVVRSALREGRVARPWIGVGAQPVTGEAAQALRLDRPGGALINGIYPGGPAARAGLRVGDVVTAVDGRPVDDPQALRFLIVTRPVGSTVPLEIVSEGRTRTVILTVDLPPDLPPRRETPLRGRANPLNGATVANLNPSLADDLGLGALSTGVVILSIEGGSAQRLKLRPGDRIVAINGVEVDDVTALTAALAAQRREWDIAINRGGRVTNIRLRG